MAFDPLNLLLLAIALIVFWRLKSVLGARTGNERPPVDPLRTARKGDPPVSKTESEGKVLRFPPGDEGRQTSPAAEEEPAAPVWTGFAEAGTELAKGLQSIADADQGFTPKSFIEGAKIAYEMVIDAFARGDKNALKNLLSRDVLESFSKAIDERERSGQRVESRFVGINSAKITAATLTGNRASVTLQFVSELISATYAKSDEVIDGDPKGIREITDVWTFERDTTSKNPNWKLAATQTPA